MEDDPLIELIKQIVTIALYSNVFGLSTVIWGFLAIVLGRGKFYGGWFLNICVGLSIFYTALFAIPCVRELTAFVSQCHGFNPLPLILMGFGIACALWLVPFQKSILEKSFLSFFVYTVSSSLAITLYVYGFQDYANLIATDTLSGQCVDPLFNPLERGIGKAFEIATVSGCFIALDFIMYLRIFSNQKWWYWVALPIVRLGLGTGLGSIEYLGIPLKPYMALYSLIAFIGYGLVICFQLEYLLSAKNGSIVKSKISDIEKVPVQQKTVEMNKN